MNIPSVRNLNSGSDQNFGSTWFASGMTVFGNVGSISLGKKLTELFMFLTESFHLIIEINNQK